MLLHADAILRALGAEVQQLDGAAQGAGVASSRQSVQLALRLLLVRESLGAEGVKVQCRNLSDVLRPLLAEMSAVGVAERALRGICDELDRLGAASDVTEIEASWRSALAELESFTLDHLSAQPAAWAGRMTAALTGWEERDLQQQMGVDVPAAATDPSIDAEKMQRYLRERFDDSSILVAGFKQLAGGFGKQTFLFETTGQHLTGAFVLRRDQLEPVMDNDCHRIEHEYALIRAVHARGFPAPEALWLDLDHRLLAGGNFLVMRRAPGVPGGSVFSAQAKVPENLSHTLAEILGRLHALPPMSELATLTESLNGRRWTLSMDDCARQYLEQWLALYRRDTHLPSPAIAGLFTWLLANRPVAAQRPVLLHGDIGFHNFLFDGPHLSAVLDWEFAHLGDPAEDLAYVRNTLGAAIDWMDFMQAYRKAGGQEVTPERIRFYQVWGHLRNAACSSIIAGKFAHGRILDLKMVQLPHLYIPLFLKAAQVAIDSVV